MKNLKRNSSLFFILMISMTLFQNCQSQTKENPKYLGSEHGIFDLDRATFNENVETLFSKVQHVALDRTEGKSKAWIYRNKIDDSGIKPDLIRFFDIENNRINVITNHKKAIQAFTSFIETDKNPESLISKINTKYASYKVNLKPDKNLDFSHSKLYQWNLPDKIYAITISKLKEGYTLSIVVARAGIDKNTLSVDGSPVCLDNSCKE
ncbi:hypothetical protein [Chryseobacterium gregarium]|uniref:hypothetical protein n=1 Tax=Chryseobacterium gregarium TaxID=456299 RepID=UPI00041E86F6|nr:hypothetical protein [Chryseobacterium gregarium]